MKKEIPRFYYSTIFLIIPILYFNSCTFEFVKHYSIVLPIVAASAFLWLVFLAKERAGITIRNMLYLLLFLFALGIFCAVGWQSRVPVLITDFTNALYMFFFMCVFAVYANEKYKFDRSIILVVLLTDTTLSCLYSIYRLIEEPNLSRLLSTGSYHETAEATNARGVVSFGVIYGLVLVMTVFLFLCIREKRNRLINISLFVIFALVLTLAQFLIAILLVVIGGALIIIMSNSRKDIYNRIRLFMLVGLGIVGVVVLPSIIEFVIGTDLFGYEVDARLREVLMLLKGENLEGTDVSVRFSQYSLSLSAFFSSFGMGKVVFNNVNVGSHSQWLDGFGNYGWIFFLYVASLFVFRNCVLRILRSEENKNLYGIIFMLYVGMSIVNTSAWAPITLSLCVVVPFLCLNNERFSQLNGDKINRLDEKRKQAADLGGYCESFID